MSHGDLSRIPIRPLSNLTCIDADELFERALDAFSLLDSHKGTLP